MTRSKNNSEHQLKEEYFQLVKKGISIQMKGDIKAYTVNAIQAENVAQKIQRIARDR